MGFPSMTMGEGFLLDMATSTKVVKERGVKMTGSAGFDRESRLAAECWELVRIAKLYKIP
jgi:hypothetical protein